MRCTAISSLAVLFLPDGIEAWFNDDLYNNVPDKINFLVSDDSIHDLIPEVEVKMNLLQ